MAGWLCRGGNFRRKLAVRLREIDIQRTRLLLDRLELSLALRQTLLRSASEIVLMFPNEFAPFDPSIAVFVPPFPRKFVECWPVNGVVIFELNISTSALQEMSRRYMLTEVLVELEFLPRYGVDEWRDQFEEAPNYKGH